MLETDSKWHIFIVPLFIQQTFRLDRWVQQCKHHDAPHGFSSAPAAWSAECIGNSCPRLSARCLSGDVALASWFSSENRWLQCTVRQQRSWKLWFWVPPNCSKLLGNIFSSSRQRGKNPYSSNVYTLFFFFNRPRARRCVGHFTPEVTLEPRNVHDAIGGLRTTTIICASYITSVCRNSVLCRIFFRLISIATAEPAASICLKRLSFRWQVWTSRGSSILFVDSLLASCTVQLDHAPLTDGDVAFVARLPPDLKSPGGETVLFSSSFF